MKNKICMSLHICRLISSQFHLLINLTYMTPFKVNFLEHKSIIKIGSLYNYLFKIEIILPTMRITAIAWKNYATVS